MRGALVALLGGTFGYLVATQLVFPASAAPTGFTEVPDVGGMPVTEASQTFADAGLTVAVIDSLLHPNAAAGSVLGQSPLPGQMADATTEVRLTISAGAQQLPVPEVVGVQLVQATDLLGASGFGFQVDTVESEEPRGEVVSSDPGVGSMVTVPSQISLEVSAGPPPIPMPQLVGMDEEDARSALDSLGLEVGDIEERFRFGLDQGKVVEQEPAPGVTVDVGSSVRLVVGRRGGGAL